MLKNNVVAVTGGAGLIGKSFSKAIIENGGKVILEIFLLKGAERCKKNLEMITLCLLKWIHQTLILLIIF